MTEAILYPEWRNEHEESTYPFADGATLRNADGDVIPKGLFLDARLYPVGGQVRQFLSRVTASPTEITLAVSDASGELASGAYDPATPEDVVPLSDAYGRPAGVLVGSPEELAVLASWSPGDHLFTEAQAEFTATVVIPTPQLGVNGIVLDDGELFTGAVWIIGAQGVFLTREAGNIRVDVMGDPKAQQRFCSEYLPYESPWFVQTINGISGNEYGDFKLLPGSAAASDTILRIERSSSALVLKLIGV